MQTLWQQALANIETVLTPQSFTTWIRPLRFLEYADGRLLLEVPNPFFQEWVEERYRGILEEAVTSVANCSVRLEFRVASLPEATAGKPATRSESPAPALPVPEAVPQVDGDQSLRLSPKYSFETFVCGGSNQFAYAAAQAVAEHPATKYNPLFIYGGVGLGKTHLLSAIGNQILSRNRKARICYYSSEKFMNEMINCIRYKRMEDFRAKFRKADVLLIDDIQFMAGKEATQEEFFHTFNSLYESHKQIVVTSDKMPKEIAGLEERLRSRFEWGLIADISPPDIETKIAILKKKAELGGIELPDDVALFIASGTTSNIRELEGMLVRLGAYASLTGSAITLPMARENLKDIIVDKNKEVTIEIIQKQVGEFYGIKLSELKSDKRLKSLVLPRQVAIYLCRELTKASYPEIGERFGGRDHSTIIHSVRKMEKELAQNFELKQAVEEIRRLLLS